MKINQKAEDTFSPVIGDLWPSEKRVEVYKADQLRNSPKDPVITLRAFIRPLSSSKAEDFQKLWKTPHKKAGFFHNITKSDQKQSTERVGKELAHELWYPCIEY